MSEEKRSAYQREMDEVRLSDEKKEETLRLMLAANREARGKEARPGTAFSARRVVPVLAAAAAVAVLLIFGPNLFRPSVTFGSVSLSTLPVVTVSRGAEEEEAVFEEVFGRTPSSLFPGWEIRDVRAAVWTDPSGDVGRGTFRASRGRTVLSVGVSTREPPLYTALADTPSGLEGVRLNRDPESGGLHAVARCGDFYVSISSVDLAVEDAFVDAVREVTAQWNRK